MTLPTRARAIAALGAVLAAALSGCTVAGAGSDADNVVTVGYQSKTINTVTAGTLLRERGYFERELDKLGGKDDTSYDVKWMDYEAGAPITAQMLAGKIDIGSMGDYPLLINGSRAGTSKESGTQLISVTGYNLKGALNGVVVDKDSSVKTLKDLKNKSISASVGSAGHGTLIQALDAAGIDPQSDVDVENQQPSVGTSALESGSVDALAQFVAWPGQLAYQDDARLVYDGGELNVPTFHGVITRNDYVAEHKDVVEAFLRAQLDATNFLHRHPLQASKIVAKETGIPVEVVYLYNGPGGVASFDPTLKPQLINALKQDLPFLKSIDAIDDSVDVGDFVDDSLLRKVYGPSYAKDTKSLANPAPITGRDTVCGRAVSNPTTAGEVWVDGESQTRPVSDPTCLLRTVAQLGKQGKQIRAAYIPDASTGTRWFADKMVWLRDGKDFRPFATQETADAYATKHPGAKPISYDAAVKAA